VGVETAAEFRDLRRLASVGERDVHCDSVIVVSRLPSQMKELVCSSDHLGGD